MMAHRWQSPWALLLLLSRPPWDAALAQATASSTPTDYLDVHLVSSIASTGSTERGFIFRLEASGSDFAPSPPRGPAWSTHSALTGGEAVDPDHLASKATPAGRPGHPAHRLMLPPAADAFLCNEAEGAADYTKPASLAEAETLESGYEGSYVLVRRGRCTFEAKARSAQRLGSAGVIVRNTLESQYSLIDEDAPPRGKKATGPDWGNTKWPEDQRDYECGIMKTAADGVGWRAEIEAALLDFNPAPYVAATNDALLTGTAADGNLCAAGSADLFEFQDRCPSRRCLLTGRNASAAGALEACCAWDTYTVMAGDGPNDGDAVPQEEEEAIVIPALFVTVEHGEELYDVVVDAALERGDLVQFVTVVPYGRWYPTVHYSSAVIWALAVATLWFAARASAQEYRASWKKISQSMNDGVLVFQRGASNVAGRERMETEDTVDLDEETVDFELAAPEVEMIATENGSGNDNGGAVAPTSPGVVPTSPGEGFSISDDTNEDDFVGSPGTAPGAAPPAPPTSPPPSVFSRPDDARQLNVQPGPVPPTELGPVHGLLFVVAASAFLVVLFFFDLDKMIRILYGLGGSVAMNQIAFHPLYTKVLREKKVFGAAVAKKLNKTAFANLPGCRGVSFTWIEVASSLTGYSLGIAWIIVGLTRVRPLTNPYYWFIQDVMGVCFCVLILGLIHINTIMVASMLLFLVFVYDIFHVLISPHIFGTSVMVDVAMGTSRSTLSHCLKYPLEKACKGRFAPLPQILVFPWMNDFRGSFSMLGLGDIILPGLLVSFAARYDAATALVRKCTQASTSSTEGGETIDESIGDGSSTRGYLQLGQFSKSIFQGYFGPLTVAYSIGLMTAYFVVWTTQRGQPALLYLVPVCLGTVLFLGWRRRELSELWSGPRVMKKANRMVTLARRIPEAPSASLPANSVMV